MHPKPCEPKTGEIIVNLAIQIYLDVIFSLILDLLAHLKVIGQTT